MTISATLSQASVRWPGQAAILAATIAVLLTPLMITTGTFEPGEGWSDAFPLERAFGPPLESWGLLDFGRESLPYHLYGKPFFLVYVLLIPIFRALRALHREAGERGRLVEWTWRVMYAGLLAGLGGDFVAYWGMSFPGLAGEIVGGIGFSVELLGILLLVLTTTLYGLAAFRLRVVASWVAVVLMLTAPFAVAVSATLTNYVPNSFVVPMSLAWAIVGVWLLSTGQSYQKRDMTAGAGAS